MTDKILISIEDPFIKGIVIKNIFERNLDFVEALNEKDLRLKLNILKGAIFSYIIQITPDAYREQYGLIRKLKQETSDSGFPVMAIIPDGSVEFVGGAKKAGIEDVILIPEKRDLFKDFFTGRFNEFIKKYPVAREDQLDLEKLRMNILSSLSANDELKHEIKRAARGKYSVSFVMGRLTGIHISLVQDFYDSLRKEMRDTDKIINYDYRTFVVVCPFTVKSFLIEIEAKIREAFGTMFGSNYWYRKLDMYGVTYPDDGKSIEKLVDIMEKGVHDSIIISSIHEPLNTLSRERLEEYKNMLKLYK